MKKIVLILAVVVFATAGFFVFSDISAIKSYAQKVGDTLGYGIGYTEKSMNAVQDSVNSTTSAIDDLKEGKARALIEEQRKKIEEMRKELEQAMNESKEEVKTKE